MSRCTDDSPEQLRLGEGADRAYLRRAWRNVLHAIMPQIAGTVRPYLEAIEPLDRAGDRISLRLDNAFGRQWVKSRYAKLIEEHLSEQLGFPVRIELVGEDTQPETETLFALPESQPEPTEPRPAPIPNPQFNPLLTFETFVVGASNRLAYSAGRAIVDQPGKRYNPFVMYGAPGLGKTHLLHAIGQAFLARSPQSRVVYGSGAQFVREYVDAVRAGKAEAFRERYRTVHLWLVDDVQFLTGKERSQEEFFHIYNALYSAGCQVVMTSDKSPQELMGLEERLRSRFVQGLCVDIGPPDFETRVAILMNKAQREGVPLPREVAEFVADKIHSNVRVLEGALTRLMAHCSLEGQPISLALASEVLRRYLVDAPPSPITVQRVLEAVCEAFGISLRELTGKSRSSQIVPIRQIAVYAIRDLTGESWTQIAHALGRNDHTTVLHAYKQVAQRLPRDPRLHEVLRRIRERVQR